MSGKQARIGITLGDPAGVGPEIAAKAIQAMPLDARDRTVVIGTPERPAIAVRRRPPHASRGWRPQAPIASAHRARLPTLLGAAIQGLGLAQVPGPLAKAPIGDTRRGAKSCPNCVRSSNTSKIKAPTLRTTEQAQGGSTSSAVQTPRDFESSYAQVVKIDRRLSTAFV